VAPATTSSEVGTLTIVGSELETFRVSPPAGIGFEKSTTKERCSRAPTFSAENRNFKKGPVTVTVGDVRLVNPVADAVIVYVPPLVGVPTLAESERISFWCSVTLAGVITTIPAGEPATAKLTVMSALATSQKPQPGVYAYMARECGALKVVREVGTPEPRVETQK